MLCRSTGPGRVIFNIVLPILFLSVFSFVIEAMPCPRGFVLEEPGGAFNRFKSLLHARSLGSRSETEKIDLLIQELRPREIKALKRRDIEMLERKHLFRLFSPEQLVLFNDTQRSWSYELRKKIEVASETMRQREEDSAFQSLLRERHGNSNGRRVRSRSDGYGPFYIQ